MAVYIENCIIMRDVIMRLNCTNIRVVSRDKEINSFINLT